MFTPEQLSIVVLVLALLLIVALGWLIYIHMQLGRLQEHYSRLLADAKVPDLESAWDNHLDKIATLTQHVDEIAQSQVQLVRRMQRVIQRVGVIKYDDTQDARGGKQSFLLALLDATNSGILINSIHSRASSRVYLKHIQAGATDTSLSKDEQEVIAQAATPTPTPATNATHAHNH